MMKGRLMKAFSLFTVYFCIQVIQFVTAGYSSIDCKQNDRLALLKFKQGLVDPSGRLSSWAGENCCRWEGVRCSNRTGHVIKLQLHNPSSSPDEDIKYLSGKIGPSLLELKHLRYLDLSSNRFDGASIPQFIDSLTRLRYLNLSDAQFGGMIPHQLGNLSSLQYLDLHWLDIPPRDLVADNLPWLSQLSSLRYLDMSAINLSKADVLNEVNKLSKLSVLRLSDCKLESIPSSLPYVNFTSLTTLDISYNNLCRELPSWLFNISSLRSIDLSFNQFHSPISGFGKLTSLQVLQLGNNYFNVTTAWNIGNLCNLHILDLSSNGISGDISNTEKDLSGCVRYSLQILNLEGNALSGKFPDWIGEFRNLESLNLGNNNLSGLIPPSLGNLSSLRYLYLPNNMLQGPIPESFGQLSELIVLDVGFNQLSGIVSDVHFSNMTKLEALLLPSNSLVLNFSSNWRPQFQLKNIDLQSCVIGPNFPAWLQTQRMFSTLDVSNGSISTTVPDWFWNLSSRVYYLNLSHNQIRGAIPEFFSFKNATIIDLQSNQFHGSLPHIGDGVQYLYLSDNSFSGDLHPVLNSKTNLWSISLSQNRVSGTIPPSMCAMSMLDVLDISSNLLSGEIPSCLKVSIYSLSVINFANNKLSGNIPQWIGTQTFLESLHLSNNSLHGEIPSLENCTSLYILDLGENKLKGSIPSWIGENLRQLKILRLRSNMLDGIIPEQLARLTDLQVLDLANNKLSGTIPQWISNLSAMVSTKKSITEFFIDVHSSDMVDHVSFDLTAIYTESLLVTIKGRELEYSKTLSLVVCLDLSENNLSGQLPDSLTNLLGLQSLNLSGNHLTGSISSKIGELQQLESLDLSKNQLNSEIPSSISSLYYLSYLNLSYNNLSGRIPVGNQLQSLIDPTIYAGNPDLCGTPLKKKCPGDEIAGAPVPVFSTDDNNESENLWYYLGIMVGFVVGFVVGFWAFCGTLLLKKSWRVSYFHLVDKISCR